MQLQRSIMASELNKRLEWKKVDWKPLEAVRDVEFRPPGVWGREYYGRRQYVPTHHQKMNTRPLKVQIHQRAVLTMLPQKIHQCTMGPLKDKVKISQVAQWFFPLICSNGSNFWKYLARNPEKWAEDVKSWERCQKSSLQWIDYSLSESQVAKKVWKM